MVCVFTPADYVFKLKKQEPFKRSFDELSHRKQKSIQSTLINRIDIEIIGKTFVIVSPMQTANACNSLNDKH